MKTLGQTDNPFWYGKHTLTAFKYLGWIIITSYDDWPVMVGNLQKARKSWSQYSRILGREGTNPRVLRVLFKTVVQAVIIFQSDMWAMNPCMSRTLGGVQVWYRVYILITGRHSGRVMGRSWYYPPLETAMQEAGFEELEAYVLRMKNTVYGPKSYCP